MKIQDFVDMKEFEAIMSNWAIATGLATVAVDMDGNYISQCYNFTDFCIKYTRGSSEGLRRCVQCDREGHGIYHCHAGLIDFGIDLVVKGEKLGSVIGGQVLPENPDDDYYRKLAGEIGVNPDAYVNALHKVTVRTEEEINASANLLGKILNDFINAEFERKYVKSIVIGLKEGVEKTSEIVNEIKQSTQELKKLQSRQKILSLNANVEAARAGIHGKGFSVVANEVGKISESSSIANDRIEKLVNEISKVVTSMHDQQKFELLMKD
ncbi:MAG: PocR ligand-binding domain-containing protein [Lachnospiraceae bacterium]|nr:PocR ligand-binding domain-containing protein [Lachnospiraceae bacterium]